LEGGEGYLTALIDAGNKWRWLMGDHFEHVGHGSCQYFCHCLSLEVAFSHNECAHACVYQSFTLNLATTDALILCYDDPLALTNGSQPIHVLCSLRKVFVALFNRATTALSDRVSNLLTG
jgi:hypothetical protein